MAKTKSKKITIEDALAPIEEQPYEVPENWCWTTLDQVCFFENGYAFKSDKFSDEGIPVIRISNIFDNEVSIEGCVYTIEENIDDRFVIRNGDLLIAMSGATTGKNGVYLSDQKAYLNQRVGNIKIINHDVLLEGFRNHYIASKQEEILRNAYGGDQPNISSTKIGKMLFPLPPFPEQQRIVERIESLFSKLDEAKDKAQEVVDSFDSRRATILAQAFSGKLTGKWRKKNTVDNSWKIKNFDEVAEIKSNLVDPSVYQDFPHIAPDNIEKRTGVLLEYHTIAEDGVTSGKHRFYPGQILYSKIRPYLSKVVMVDFAGLCSADMYPIEAKQNTRFLWYYMLSDEFLEAASSAGSRSVLPKINQKELSKIPVRITESEDEQGEVVRILDEIFLKENEARTLVQTVIDKIDEVKKSILTKAFRGELGTNDPSDTSALDELKSILSKEEKPMPKAKSIKIPKKIVNLLETETEKKIVRYLIINDRAVSLEELSGVTSNSFDVIENVNNLEKKQVIKKLKNGLYRMMDENAN